MGNPTPSELREMYHAIGATQQEIADKHGVSQRTVSRWLEKHGIPTSKKPTPDRLAELYHEEGYNQYELAEILDVEQTTVSDWMEQYGIDSRSLGEHWREKPAPLKTAHNGYVVWQTAIDGETVTVSVHRLTAVAEEGYEALTDRVVHHKNGVRWDNRSQNLEVMSRTEHSRHHAEERGFGYE